MFDGRKFVCAAGFDQERIFGRWKSVEYEHFEFDAVGLVRGERLTRFVDRRNFFSCEMKGEKVVGIAASAEFFDKRDREEMDRDASALENQIAGGVALMGEFGWKIAVFDDEHGFVAGSKDADFFLRIAFGDHLARHLRFF